MGFLTAQDSIPIADQLKPWLGTWEGPFKIYSNKGQVDSLSMSILIESNEEGDTLVWRTTFTQAERVIEKPYFLYAGDEENVFILDEDNSIQIPQYLLGSEMISYYSVMKSNYMVIYRLLDDENMIFSIVVLPEGDPIVTGGENEIPLVENHKVTMTQTAELKKIK